jgi:5S rRNA maturation endonuclease (ribonuclease M5)
LSTRLKEKLEKIQQLLSNLREESTKGTPIVVEGKKDIASLKNFGVSGQIIAVKTGGKSFTQATTEIEKTGAKEIILLLDFDRRGEEGAYRLKADLERSKIKPILSYWNALFALVGREVQCIESLPSYMQTLEDKTLQL